MVSCRNAAPEAKFEVAGDIKELGAPPAGRLRVLRRQKPLFFAQRYAVLGPLDKLAADEMKALLHAGGAQVMSDDAGRHDSTVTTIAAAHKCRSIDHARTLEATYKGPVVDQTWVLDSISNYQQQDMALYRLHLVLQQSKAAAANPVTGRGAPETVTGALGGKKK